MQVIMGGSGSTGSSLLKNILNRNQEIFSGEETSFFAKKMIYENWSKAKSRVLKRKYFGLRNHGWHIYNGTDLLHQEYLWERSALQKLLLDSKSLAAFASLFYAKPLKLKGASTWLEKTPANAACFRWFLRAFENGKVIHIVRNPFDTIASLQSRGFDLYYAVGIYLLNTACGLSVKRSERSYTIKYEDLTGDPENTVRKLCNFLEIEYTSHMLEPQGEEVLISKLNGWNYDETKKIEKGAVGRFNQLSDQVQDEIMEAVNMIFINEKGQGFYETKIRNVKDICEILDYDFYNIGKKTTSKRLKSLQKRDRINRISRGYPTGFYYPLEIQ